MFFNLTWRNAKRSRSENLIYFLTMITAVAMFYIVLSLGQQDVIRFLSEIESDAVERLLTNLLPTVYLCALLFVFFLVVFANKYQLECRSRELGLYLMFGMTKIKLFIQIMTEGLITSFLALLGGLVCGGFLSEAISLTTARLVGHGIITHQLSFSVSAAIFTSLGFLIIQFVALFVLCGKLFRKELHQLVYGEMAKKQRTGNPYVSFVSFAIGTVILLVVLDCCRAFYGCEWGNAAYCRFTWNYRNNSIYSRTCKNFEYMGSFYKTQSHKRTLCIYFTAVA